MFKLAGLHGFSLRFFYAVLMVAALVGSSWASEKKPTIRIGSKTFAESYILAELAAQLLEHDGYRVERKHGLGGTLIMYQALLAAQIDIYPEYTGTLVQAILKQPGISAQRIDEALSKKSLKLISRFGFNNSYAIAIASDIATKNNITNISDLRHFPDLAMAFSLEFLNREDGWPALKQHYQLQQQPRGIVHALAYPAIDSGQLAATDAYTTDGEIHPQRLLLLNDDKQFFPKYYAGLLIRENLPAGVVQSLNRLSDQIDDNTMRGLNRRVSVGGEKPEQVAADFLQTTGLISDHQKTFSTPKDVIGGDIFNNTTVHLKLTAIALGLACLVAIPAALILSQYPTVARSVIYLTGLIQTIPSLALLALMIPLVGLGETPAIIALFLYSLLPILRNTLTGLFSVDPLLKQVATGMGLTVWQQLRKIEFPLAVPQIIAGVKTAAIISIGTATLAAFVGAGGLGEPIITGLALNDHQLIAQGAIPAAMLAIVTEFIFELLEKYYMPKHLSGRR
jgi:glycine betaine/choline ABC-type transport system substrate-binding protein/ABC-type proline/glycine betaine transport system permease subunit